MPLGEPAAARLRGLRVAAQTAVERAAAALRAAGAVVENARHPEGAHAITIDVWRSYGDGVGATDLWRVLRRRDMFRTEMLAFADRFDLILCPVFRGRRAGTAR